MTGERKRIEGTEGKKLNKKKSRGGRGKEGEKKAQRKNVGK